MARPNEAKVEYLALFDNLPPKKLFIVFFCQNPGNCQEKHTAIPFKKFYNANNGTVSIKAYVFRRPSKPLHLLICAIYRVNFF